MDPNVNKIPTNWPLITGASSETGRTPTPRHQHCKDNCNNCVKQKFCEKSPLPVHHKIDLSNYVTKNGFKVPGHDPLPFLASHLPQKQF